MRALEQRTGFCVVFLIELLERTPDDLAVLGRFGAVLRARARCDRERETQPRAPTETTVACARPYQIAGGRLPAGEASRCRPPQVADRIRWGSIVATLVAAVVLLVAQDSGYAATLAVTLVLALARRLGLAALTGRGRRRRRPSCSASPPSRSC